MKIYTFLLVLLAVSCADSKLVSHEETTVIKFKTSYIQDVIPGQEDGEKLMVLTFEIEKIAPGYQLDSVYYKTYFTRLIPSNSGEDQKLMAKIRIQTDTVKVVPPYPILDTEALIRYTDSLGVRNFHKVENIIRKEPIYQP